MRLGTCSGMAADEGKEKNKRTHTGLQGSPRSCVRRGGKVVGESGEEGPRVPPLRSQVRAGRLLLGVSSWTAELVQHGLIPVGRTEKVRSGEPDWAALPCAETLFLTPAICSLPPESLWTWVTNTAAVKCTTLDESFPIIFRPSLNATSCRELPWPAQAPCF